MQKQFKNKKEIANYAFISPYEPEDLSAWETDILCLALDYKGLGRVRSQLPSFRVCIFGDPHPLCHLNQLLAAHYVFFVSMSFTTVLFVWIFLPHTALSGGQDIPGVTGVRRCPSASSGDTNKPGFPFSFPTSHCQTPSTYLKKTFLESWPPTATGRAGS